MMFKPLPTSDFQQLLNELYSLQRLGIKTGLEHTEQLLDSCGNPHKYLRFIHIAGTNGKGSTSAIISSILQEAGYKTGLYTSPHLVRFNERIRVNGIEIPDEEIVLFMKLFKKHIHKIESTFFETTTALAYWYFQKQNVDIAVIETGLGGRLDSTNVIVPDVSVITSISLDHQEILGETIEKIAKEKAGIIKRGVPVVSIEQSEPIKAILKQKANEMETAIHFIQPDRNSHISKNGTHFLWRNNHYTVGLAGRHQAKNASLALKTTEIVEKNMRTEIIKKGLKNVQWPGRFQLMSENPFIVYDVAHNAQGIKYALETFCELAEENPIGLFALKEDKILSLISSEIKNQFAELIITDDRGEMLADAESVSNRLGESGITARPIKGIKNALTKFESLVKQNQGGLIFGSHYMAKAVFNFFHFPFDT